MVVESDLNIVAVYSEQVTPPTGCFIATAAYGSPLAPQLDTLRQFRDYCLPEKLTNLYYRLSPPIAKFVWKHTKVRSAVRAVIDLLVKALKQ